MFGRCPNGKHLYRAEVIRESTVVRYRALAHQCNSCPIKNRCTDSDEGRVIEVQRDSWLESELRNFHRGLSLTLLLLADLILVVTILRQNDTRSQLLLALPFTLHYRCGPSVIAKDSFDRPGRELGRMAQRRHPELRSQLDSPTLENDCATRHSPITHLSLEGSSHGHGRTENECATPRLA